MGNMEELYKMILVDDEDEVRGRISSKISEESGFTVVGAAGNGYDALELIEKHSPHVVLTDIKMPFIDGIELATIIKRDYPATRVAFITGYDEFDYAREAVELHVSSYLTKPVTQNDISRFLDKLKAELDDEFKKQYNLEILRKRYEESIPLIIDNYFTSFLITSSEPSPGDIENLKQYGVFLDDGSYLLSLVQLERSADLEDVMEYEKRKLSVRSVIKTILERNHHHFYSFHFNDGLVFIIKEEGPLFRKKIDTVFYEMVQMNRKFLSARIDIGVSTLHTRFGQLKEAYLEAEKALGYSQFLNTGRIVYIDQLEEEKPRMISLGEPEIKAIEYALKFGSAESLELILGQMKDQALREHPDVTSFKLYVINLANIVVNFAETLEGDPQELLGGDILEKMTAFRNLEQLFDWVLAVLLKLKAAHLDRKMTNSQRFLDRAVGYIDQNYTNPDISMDEVCEYLGISISYLSLLFKKHRDTTFVKYLTGVRMEKARELLTLTDHRIIEIAEKCGYRDVYYFSHSFKKFMGVSPKRYREEIHP
jgi:two-component system response regulator YesN